MTAALQPIPLDDAERMLSYVRGVDDRDTWVRMAYALQHEYGETAFDVWDRWSQNGASYNSRDARSVWKSCGKQAGGKPVTIGSLVAAAKEGGWRPERAAAPVDPDAVRRAAEERARRAEERRQQTEREQAEAAEKAARMWASAKPANGHPYLTRKGIACDLTAKSARELGDLLLIPVKRSKAETVSLQCIAPDGTRNYLRGGETSGCYTTIGTPVQGKPVVIVEGYATGVSVALATGWCVVVAFAAGNLESVARKIRAAMPNTELIIGGDDDAFTAGNPGRTNAEKAARAVAGMLAFPMWLGDRGTGTDFNDLHQSEGLDAVRACFDDPRSPDPEPPADDPFDGPDDVDPDTGEIMPTSPPYRDAAEVAAPQFQADPLDLFQQTPAPPILPDMLPAQIAEWAFDQAEMLAVDPAMLAMPALVACAAAIHDGIEIQPKRHERQWRESARLWCAVVGPPSVRKSPSIKRATSRLRKINKDLVEDNIRRQAEHSAAMEEYREAKKAAKRADEAPPSMPEEPQLSRMIVEDITVEALSEVLKHNARGVLCIQDELTGWFGSMDAYSGNKSANKDRAHWLEIYNGGHRTVDRVMRGHVSIPNWSACMIGGIQPDMMRRIAANMGEDGLMQRFMVVIGRNTGAEIDRPENEQARHAYSDLIDGLYRIGPSDTPVMLSEAAHIVRERVTALANDLTNYPALPGGLRSHLGKWSGLFARLLLTFHVIECNAKSVYPTTIPVQESTALQVENLMCNFLLRHALAFYNDVMSEGGDLEHQRWIAGHILANNLQRITGRELSQCYRAWRGMDDWRRQRIMQGLEDAGWIAPDDAQPNRARKLPTAWRVHPNACALFAERAVHEAKRRGEVAELLRKAQR